jgi:hypothetical protein
MTLERSFKVITEIIDENVMGLIESFDEWKTECANDLMTIVSSNLKQFKLWKKN